MHSRRFVPALLAALLISGTCTLLLSRRLTPRAGAHPTMRRYLAASQAIAPGEVLEAGLMQTISLPMNETMQGAYVKPEDVIGRAAIYPIAAGEPILDADLAARGAGLGITTRIPKGMRALALKSDDIVGVGGFVFPGSRVDVLVTYRTDRSPEPMTATVLQDAEVLAAGHQTQPNPNGKPETVNVVTLLLTPEAAERVVLASTQGTIHFVLRNGVDRQQVAEAPAQLSQFGGPAAPAPVARRATFVRPIPTRPYIVETILGDKTSKTEF